MKKRTKTNCHVDKLMTSPVEHIVNVKFA